MRVELTIAPCRGAVFPLYYDPKKPDKNEASVFSALASELHRLVCRRKEMDVLTPGIQAGGARRTCTFMFAMLRNFNEYGGSYEIRTRRLSIASAALSQMS